MLNNRALKITLMSTTLLLVAVCLSFARTDHKEYTGAPSWRIAGNATADPA